MAVVRKQYHHRKVGDDWHIWDVHRLMRMAKLLERQKIPLNSIAEADENWWYQDPNSTPTPRALAEHMVLVERTDLAHPIILCAEGRLMDGMHRVVKAILENRNEILAIQFPQTPKPDFINVSLNDLPYPDEDV